MFIVTYTSRSTPGKQWSTLVGAADAEAARRAVAWHPGRKIISVVDAIGTRVESSRWGAGQPRIAGVVTSVSRGLAVIQPDDGSDQRRRSISNLRPA